MTATIHYGIREAVATAYRNAAAVTSLLAAAQIKGNRDAVLAQGVAADIQVKRRRSVAADPEMLGAAIDWTTDILTRIRARDEATADAIAAACFATVMADQTLGGLAGYIVADSFDWEEGQADTNVCAVDFVVRVVHRGNSSTSVT
jgi:hypothetical protein